jgi:hypothetical protein
MAVESYALKQEKTKARRARTMWREQKRTRTWKRALKMTNDERRKREEKRRKKGGILDKDEC